MATIVCFLQHYAKYHAIMQEMREKISKIPVIFLVKTGVAGNFCNLVLAKLQNRVYNHNNILRR